MNDRPRAATIPTPPTNSTDAHGGAKKDEIKMLPAVVPVLGYTTAAAPNIYPPIETGVQLFTGTQPTQSAAFPTTYQQGVCFDFHLTGFACPTESNYFVYFSWMAVSMRFNSQ